MPATSNHSYIMLNNPSSSLDVSIPLEMSHLLDVPSTHLDVPPDEKTLASLQKWKPLFDKFDLDGNGVISMEAFQVILYKYGLREELDPHKREVLENTIEENTGGVISYQEFVNIMSDKRSLSFSLAVRAHYEEHQIPNTDTDGGFIKVDKGPLTCRQRFLKIIADEVLTSETERQYFRFNFSWCLPPVFIFVVTWIELSFYIALSVNCTRSQTNVTGSHVLWTGPTLTHGWLAWDPNKKIQFWRFLSYILVHGGIAHVTFNCSVQLLVGVPLEFVHGTRRIGSLYLISIAAGSMGTSVFDGRSYLVGASAGSYALLSAHLANIALHFPDSKLSPQRIAVIIICVSTDFGLAVYRRYSGVWTATSFVAHLMGITVGLTIGLFILRNYEQRLHERPVMWIAMVTYILFILFVVFWNIFYKPSPV